jgi:hypothetical protein
MNKIGNSTLKICVQKLNFLNYSNNTAKMYCYYIEEFLKNQTKSCVHLNSKDFQDYISEYKIS